MKRVLKTQGEKALTMLIKISIKKRLAITRATSSHKLWMRSIIWLSIQIKLTSIQCQ